MSILLGAFGGSPGPIQLSAVWGNIVDATPGLANANVTLTFSGGVARTLRIEHALGGGIDFEYRINSGTYTNCPTGTEFSVSSGDTLNFRVNSGSTITSNVDVFDLSISASVALDTFSVNLS